ncbi:MAG: hypothetical protein AAF639_44335 [Chloroflexota bacterium]
MSVLTKMQTAGQDSINMISDMNSSQPSSTKKLVGVAVGGVGGGLVLAALGKGALTIASFLMSPVITFTAGAVAGGIYGWSYMHAQLSEEDDTPMEVARDTVEDIIESVAETVADVVTDTVADTVLDDVAEKVADTVTGNTSANSKDEATAKSEEIASAE